MRSEASGEAACEGPLALCCAGIHVDSLCIVQPNRWGNQMRPVLESEAAGHVRCQEPMVFNGTRWVGGNMDGEGPGDNPTGVAAKGGKLQEPEAADMRKLGTTSDVSRPG